MRSRAVETVDKGGRYQGSRMLPKPGCKEVNVSGTGVRSAETSQPKPRFQTVTSVGPHESVARSARAEVKLCDHLIALESSRGAGGHAVLANMKS
jgi:hypothetical protein